MRWFRDTLFLRLFLLMWAALVASHIVAFGVVTGGPWSGMVRGGGLLPIFPSLPPTPGLPDEMARRPQPRDPGGDGPRLPPAVGPREPPPDGVRRGLPPQGLGPAPSLPTSLLVADYLIRLVVIGIAAALGARWLSRPVGRLVAAAQALGPSLGGDARLPEIDERRGTVEVREAARVFNRMARELDAQFRARGLLMAALSHDLRTPLTRMRMRLEGEAAPFVARCIADIREMTSLVENALETFRRSDAAEPPQPIDVDALLRSICDDMAEAGQAVRYESASDGTNANPSAVAIAQPVALRRVVANLLGNAMRYGGSAAVAIAGDARRVVVTIDDAGPGIAPALLEAVFEPFFRVEGSRNRSSGGVGLGLYIARDLLRRQGGELTLANRKEGGLRAEFFLPRASVDAAGRPA